MDFTDNQDVLELFKHSQYFDSFDNLPFDNLTMHQNYMFRDLKYIVNEQGIAKIDFNYSGLQKGNMYIIRVLYKGGFTYRYLIQTDLIAHVTELQDELLVTGFDKNGDLLHNATAKLYYRNNNDEYIISESTAYSNQIKFNKYDIQKALAVMVVDNDTFDKTLIMLDQEDQNMTGKNREDNLCISKQQVIIDEEIFDIVAYTKFDKPYYHAGDTVKFKATFKSTDDLVNFNMFDVNGIEYILVDDFDNLFINSPTFVNKEYGYIVGEFNISDNINIEEYSTKIQFKKDGEIIGDASYTLVDNKNYYETLKEDLPSTINPTNSPPTSMVYDANGELLYKLDNNDNIIIVDDEQDDKIELVLSNDYYQLGDIVDVKIKHTSTNANTLKNGQLVISLVKDKVLSSQVVSLSDLSESVRFTLNTDITPVAYITVVYVDPVKGVVTLQKPIFVEQTDKKLNVTLDTTKVGEQINISIDVADYNGVASIGQDVTLRIYDKQYTYTSSKQDATLYNKIYNSFTPSIKYSYAPVIVSDNTENGINDLKADYQTYSGYFVTDLITDENGQATFNFTPVNMNTEWVIDVEAISSTFEIGNKEIIVSD